MVDLRSDTVTTPTDAMRKVIADARHRGEMNVRPAIMEYLRDQS